MGTRLTAQAKKGISREAEQQVTLSGDAMAVRQADLQSPRVELRGDTLTAWLKEERLVSDQPVRITRGSDVFSAQTMNFDVRSGQYELQGQVPRRFAATSDALSGLPNRLKSRALPLANTGQPVRCLCQVRVKPHSVPPRNDKALQCRALGWAGR